MRFWHLATLVVALWAAPLSGANVVWNNAGADGLWHTDGNWVGGSKPGALDVAVFNNTSDDDCSNEGGTSVVGILLDTGYDGTVDLTDETVAVGSSGVVVDSGTLDINTAQVTITGGPLDWLANDVDFGESTVTLGGTCTITGDKDADPYNLINHTTGVVTLDQDTDTRIDVRNTSTFNGTLVVEDSWGVWTGSATIGASADLSSFAAGDYIVISGCSGSDPGLTAIAAGAVVDANMQWNNNSSGPGTIPAYTYGGSVVIAQSGALTNNNKFGAGDFVLNAGLTWSCAGTGTTTLDLETNDVGTITVNGDITVTASNSTDITVEADGGNPDWVITGDVVDAIGGTSTLTWKAGTGTITASGAADPQDWDWMGQTVEAIVIAKTASDDTLTFSGNVICASLTATTGELDFNGTTIETTGAMTIGPACTIEDTTLAGTTLTVGGAFTATGPHDGDLDFGDDGAGFDLDVTGHAQAHFATIKGCTAGTSTLYARRSHDEGGNTNVLFLRSPRTIPETDPSIDVFTSRLMFRP